MTETTGHACWTLVVERGLQLPDQGWNPGPLHWSAVSHWGRRKGESEWVTVFCVRVCLCVCVCVFSVMSNCNPMDCSPPGSSVHGIFQVKNTGVGCHFLLQEVFPTKGSNQCLLCLLDLQLGLFNTKSLGENLHGQDEFFCFFFSFNYFIFWEGLNMTRISY